MGKVRVLGLGPGLRSSELFSLGLRRVGALKSEMMEPPTMSRECIVANIDVTHYLEPQP